jgi:hypothetical protein
MAKGTLFSASESAALHVNSAKLDRGSIPSRWLPFCNGLAEHLDPDLPYAAEAIDVLGAARWQSG